MGIIKYIKHLFGIHETGTGRICMIPLNKIKITPDFTVTSIGEEKWFRKLKYFKKLGKFESQIILKRDFTLVDGYSSYLIAKFHGLKNVLVYFVD